jgi:hypothetical protein
MSALRTSAGLSGVLEIKRFLDETLCNFCVTRFFLRISKRGLRVGPFRASGRLDPFYVSI